MSDKDKAQAIYDLLYGKPKTHQQWAQGFNVRYKILTIISHE